MAGSWDHIVDDDGAFLGDRLLDSGGDVQEALLECYGMVWYLAARFAPVLSTPNVLVEPSALVEIARRHYQDGLEASPSNAISKRGGPDGATLPGV